MDPEGWMFGGYMAEQERLRAQEEADKKMQAMKEEYDDWCNDHGIPPPPDSDPQPKRNPGCLCLALVFLCLAVLILSLVFIW